jgi:hypothetical protein
MATSDQRVQDDGKLPASWRKLLLTVHVLTTVGVFGTDLVLVMLGVWSVVGADPQTVYPAAHLIGQVLVAPLAIASLGTGVALALLTPWGLLRYWWTAIKLTITAVLTGAVVFVLVPQLGAGANATTGLTPRALTTAEKLPLLLAPAVASSLLVLNVALAIYKPRWRLRYQPDELQGTRTRQPAAYGGVVE